MIPPSHQLEHPEVLDWRRRFDWMVSNGLIVCYRNLCWKVSGLECEIHPMRPINFISKEIRL
jgi:hypothetical protein